MSSGVGLDRTEEYHQDRAFAGIVDGPPLDFLDPAESPRQLGRLGGFVVTEVLGRGGMGIVFRCTTQG